VLAELMNNPKATASARAMAADRILDRAYGKPPQLTTTDAGQFRRACDMSDDELARVAAGGTLPLSSGARSQEGELTCATGCYCPRVGTFTAMPTAC
jgi:hypothetical protein